MQIDERGFYELRDMDSGGDALYTVAVNVDPTESDLASLDEEEFASAVTAPGASPSDAALVANLTPVERERRQSLWWHLLMAVVIVLIAESVISNRVVRRQPIGDQKG
jgi:hypothetical protein